MVDTKIRAMRGTINLEMDNGFAAIKLTDNMLTLAIAHLYPKLIIGRESLSQPPLLPGLSEARRLLDAFSVFSV